MADAIDEVEDIGKSCAEKLKVAGIKTTDQFLERAKDRKGRQALAQELGMEESRILKWANHCDLFRIKGIAGQMAELLEAAGVDTVRELSRRAPANLAKAVAEANDKRKLCDRPPGESVVAKWVEEAKSLTPIMTH